ncbi:MAG: dienelactone hydrolase family protein [Phycisphaeraceae bacterium]|nr:dienelactone hydrolase family protein [Phycisphaeraceae bacterium]
MTLHTLISLVVTTSALSLLAACAAPARAPAAETATGFILRRIEIGGQGYDYAVYVPRGYDASRAWPLVVFLHGSGESGTDGQKMIVQGIGSNVLWNASRWPCVMVMPQKPVQKAQWEAYDEVVMSIVDRTTREYTIDEDRIVLTGLSQGGHGTWTIGAAHPEVWSALVPICGYPEPMTPEAIAAGVKGIPVWCFHGEADDVVPAEKSRTVVGAIIAAGGEARLTVYPGVNHGSWDRAYGEAELPGWMLSQKK